MEQFGSDWTNLHKILYLRIFRKSGETIQISLKSDNNNGHFTGRRRYIMIISCWILLRMGNVSDKSYRENQNMHFIFFSPPENSSVNKMRKNI